MRGDRPHSWLPLCRAHRFTPHARGSTFFDCLYFFVLPVYPACAGIDLDSLVQEAQALGLPRMRGDRPFD